MEQSKIKIASKAGAVFPGRTGAKKAFQPLVHSGELVLVNPTHPFAPEEGLWEPLRKVSEEPFVELAATASRMLGALLFASGAEKAVCAVSGYRSHAQQVQLYEDSLRENGAEFTASYVALPGCSEHETGLAVDLAAEDVHIDPICPCLPYDGVYGRLRELAADYGFVERYPAGKRHITSISHEPWHFRYVGWPHAAIMRRYGLVLEEYIELLQQYTGPDAPLRYNEGVRSFSVFTLSLEEATAFAQNTREDRLWQMSGNNAGGVVVTVWA